MKFNFSFSGVFHIVPAAFSLNWNCLHFRLPVSNLPLFMPPSCPSLCRFSKYFCLHQVLKKCTITKAAHLHSHIKNLATVSALFEG